MSSLETIGIQDRLSHYQAFARQCQIAADRAVLASEIAERRYARANRLVEEIEAQLKASKR